MAEQETQELPDYYIEILKSSTLIKNGYNIVIGRKGTGKTATLYYLNSLMAKDVRNHICLIRPVNFEIDALIKILQVSHEKYVISYLVESVWKLLIYTEIAKSIYLENDTKPLYALTESQTKFQEFVKENSDLILKDFSDKLEEELEKIHQHNIDNSGEKFSDFKIKLAAIYFL